jgi:hypothetical protein
MVRVIQEANPARLDQIIKATNRQTAILPSSLRATESIHRKIENYFRANALYYDRRKNFYKNEGKPAGRIISIDKLAQAMISVVLKRPQDARARPTTLIRSDDYTSIFSEDEKTHPLELYRVVVEMLLKVEAFLKKQRSSIDRKYLNNLKFHTLMVTVWNALGSKDVSGVGISQLNFSNVGDVVIGNSLKWVMGEFDKAGGEDRVAKDATFTATLSGKWKKS